ncbi:MAG: Glycosyl transferase family 2 [Candidatus Falkowbacteria bacterium GW2011_GWC2_38_22]|uniref:Glycosyl transferase family 2 n=1 Tax=Candidatus Falkowbacteria bacterium GW2011_GWE1_38_31 TaxID=1618638 RepID=A0A0G0JXE8_9BACT|nr:MAG: Glycosyl transferase family 2 [Candidatus Falkowbacteria bacterium GW2011_GWF2_38_1205]KKQ61838.1 MAG: Glycosyl transferase family 2 [Candidatus Falkowbacteria bacterium GW2011_GWC2_38_22]KKQ64146.1 MAG: Glycosyl transferase family 2 [Candidatus Falkowbacteria bacterium GW2011_GWF1_38_22]KKQ66504.1 MAG: Glycosyl transferase family 2 [Candidatus Falkowbacteria bacterium GW2011_GWE2_38_254]KKQ71252.1 MAG: Glycosyl transferase family 2 [Candidatus Falkowbacteria bacterium GW2011_GWE1_38_31
MKINKLSIIIPVFNEEKTIEAILDRIEKSKIRTDIEKEIIIIDDGSTDGTRDILQGYADKYRIVFQEKNQGKGAAVRTGFAIASGDYAIVQDADLEYNPDDIQGLIEKAEQTDAKIVFGSRVLGLDKREETPGIFYYLGGHFLSWLTNFLYGAHITDEPTCYKMFSREVLANIKLECDGFEFCPEVTAKALKAGYEIAEAPISYKTRTKKEGKKIKLFRDGWLAIWTLLKYRFNDKRALFGFVKLYKWWLVLIAAYLLVRVVLFGGLWGASANGWENFYNQAQSGHAVLLANWHEPCDWHPPLYYFFTTVFLLMFKSAWPVYLAQMILALAGVYLIYKIGKLFFSPRVAFIATFIAAIEPYSAWHNFLLTAESLSAFFLLLGIYYFFRFFQNSKTVFLLGAAIIFGFATLTRLNTLYLPQALSLGILSIYFIRRPFGLPYFSGLKFKNILLVVLLFNAVYFAVLFPWQMRNKIVYGKYTIANVLMTNVFHYNYPTAMFIKDNISYDEANNLIRQKAENDLGKNVGDQGDCSLFSKDELVKQFDYYKKESGKYMKENFWQYTRVHLIRTAPFFLDSGYLNLIQEFTGVYAKPDITGSLMTGNFKAVFDYLKNFNFSLLAYLFGLAFWGICSLSVFGGIIYTYFKDRNKLLFFLLSAGVIIYSALLCSPFVLARYRLPVYVFFLVPFVYMIGEVLIKIKKRFFN